MGGLRNSGVEKGVLVRVSVLEMYEEGEGWVKSRWIGVGLKLKSGLRQGCTL